MKRFFAGTNMDSQTDMEERQVRLVSQVLAGCLIFTLIAGLYAGWWGFWGILFTAIPVLFLVVIFRSLSWLFH